MGPPTDAYPGDHILNQIYRFIDFVIHALISTGIQVIILFYLFKVVKMLWRSVSSK